MNKKILTTIIAVAMLVVSVSTCFADTLVTGEPLNGIFYIDKTYNIDMSTMEAPTTYTTKTYYSSTPMGAIGQLPNPTNQYLANDGDGFNAMVSVIDYDTELLTLTTIQPFFNKAIRTLSMHCKYTIDNVYVSTGTNIPSHTMHTIEWDENEIMQGGLPNGNTQTDFNLEFEIYVMKPREIFTDELNYNVIQELTTFKLTVPKSVHRNGEYFSQDIYNYIAEQMAENGYQYGFRIDGQERLYVKRITAQRTIDLLTRSGETGTVDIEEYFGKPVSGNTLKPIENEQVNALFAYSHIKDDGELPSIAEIGYFLGEPIEAFMSCEILPNVRIGHIFIACIVLTFLLIYLKFFAGG